MNPALAILFLAISLSFGCSSSSSHLSNPVDPQAVPFEYKVSAPPTSLIPGQTYLLEAAVSQAGGIGFTVCAPQWAVRESNGGTLVQEIGGSCNNINRICAQYTAPLVPGTYHVDVQEKEHPSVKATFTLVIAA